MAQSGETSALAAATHALPGPTILSTRGDRLRAVRQRADRLRAADREHRVAPASSAAARTDRRWTRAHHDDLGNARDARGDDGHDQRGWQRDSARPARSSRLARAAATRCSIRTPGVTVTANGARHLLRRHALQVRHGEPHVRDGPTRASAPRRTLQVGRTQRTRWLTTDRRGGVSSSITAAIAACTDVRHDAARRSRSTSG